MKMSGASGSSSEKTSGEPLWYSAEGQELLQNERQTRGCAQADLESSDRIDLDRTLVEEKGLRLIDCIEGAVAIEDVGDALRPMRAKAEDLPKIDKVLAWQLSQACGVKIQLQTDATSLHLLTSVTVPLTSLGASWNDYEAFKECFEKPVVFEIFLDKALYETVAFSPAGVNLDLADVQAAKISGGVTCPGCCFTCYHHAPCCFHSCWSCCCCFTRNVIFPSMLEPQTLIRREAASKDMQLGMQEINLTLPAGQKLVEIVLSQRHAVDIHRLCLGGCKEAQTVKDLPPRLLTYGSSITHSVGFGTVGEAVGGSGTWPAVCAREIGMRHLNLGVGSSCHLETFMARQIRDQPAACIVLELGINMSGALSNTASRSRFLQQVTDFLSVIREGAYHANTPILIMSPFICPWGEKQTSSHLVLTLLEIREQLESVVTALRAHGDKHIYFRSGLDLFGPKDVTPESQPDMCHFSPSGYRMVGERMAQLELGKLGRIYQLELSKAEEGESPAGWALPAILGGAGEAAEAKPKQWSMS